MIKIIIDTNIIFSCLINSNSTIGEIIFNADGSMEFYSCTYMRREIQKHWSKLKKISKLNDAELEESKFKIYNKIKFINEELITEKIWKKSELLTKEIDVDDTDFVALTLYLKGFLWTGDKELYSGLIKRDFKSVYNTKELASLKKSNV